MKQTHFLAYAALAVCATYPQAGFSTGFSNSDTPFLILLIAGFCVACIAVAALFGWLISRCVASPYWKRFIRCGCMAVLFAVPISDSGYEPLIVALFNAPNSIWLALSAAVSFLATALAFYGLASFARLEVDGELVAPHPLHSMGALLAGLFVLVLSFKSSLYGDFFLSVQKRDVQNSAMEEARKTGRC